MEFYMQKARLFAVETAKKSQEIATQAAKLSQDLATETAKRSKELAIDVSKRADQFKAYAEDQLKTPRSAVPRGPGGVQPFPSEEELEEYGITPELRDFVKGLTIKTFRDFPIDEPDGKSQPLPYVNIVYKYLQATLSVDVNPGDYVDITHFWGLRQQRGFRPETGSDPTGVQIGKEDLNPWRERHAVLVLLSVREISDFRYVLCPRWMNETRFWRIYFTLVKQQIFGSEARALEKEVALAREEEIKLLSQQGEAVRKLDIRDLRPPPPHPGEEGVETGEGGDSSSAKKKADDLDAYLLGALDSSDEGIDGDDDDGFDADFDQFVKSAVDSDVEDEAPQTKSSRDRKKAGQLMPPSTPKTLAASEVSSDGELVEIPDSESEQTSGLLVAEKAV